MKKTSLNSQILKQLHSLLQIKTGFALAIMFGALFATTTHGQVPLRQTIPDEHPGPPFYARFLNDPDNDLIPVVFYRPIDLIPEDFNLLQFFDIPRAYTAEPLLVSGFHLVKGPIPPEAPPMFQFLSGNAVPFWFVERTAAEAAAGDGFLTVDELDSIVAFRGIASFFTEEINPFSRPDGVGGAVIVQQDLVARGTLEDGRSFFVNLVFTISDLQDMVQIIIR